MHSFPTDPTCVTVEVMNPDFTKFLLKHGAVLHRFTAAHDEHFHSHPFDMWSDILTVGYWEEQLVPTPAGGYELVRHERRPGTSHHIARGTIHRIGGLLEAAGELWTVIHPYGEPLPWYFYRLNPVGQLERRSPEAGPEQWEAVIQIRTYSFQYGLLHLERLAAQATSVEELSEMHAHAGRLLESWDAEMGADEFFGLPDFVDM